MKQELYLDIEEEQIYVETHSPANPKGVVVLVHGFGEHSGRYLSHVVPKLIALDVAVVLYDNVGHGKSSGKRGHCKGYDSLLNILDTVISFSKERFSGLPSFLYGHSMGGNLVLNFVMRRTADIDAVVATSPYLKLAFSPPALKIAMGKILGGLFPSITFKAGIDASGISRIAEEVALYENDALNHNLISPNYSFPIMRAGEWAIEHAASLAVDTLLVHGTADPIIDYKATQDFDQNARKAKLVLFEGGYHELHNDLCREDMLQAVTTWLRQRL